MKSGLRRMINGSNGNKRYPNYFNYKDEGGKEASVFLKPRELWNFMTKDSIPTARGRDSAPASLEPSPENDPPTSLAKSKIRFGPDDYVSEFIQFFRTRYVILPPTSPKLVGTVRTQSSPRSNLEASTKKFSKATCSSTTSASPNGTGKQGSFIKT